MDFASSTRVAENRTRWKGIVANSSVVPRRPSKVTGWSREKIWTFGFEDGISDLFVSVPDQCLYLICSNSNNSFTEISLGNSTLVLTWHNFFNTTKLKYRYKKS